MPCKRFRNELDELVEGRFCSERTEPRDEPVRLEVLEVLVRPEVLEVPEEGVGRDPLEPVIRSCIVA
jgi:hypothetical protein